MFNTFIPIAKPPTFGVSTQEVTELANRIRGILPAPQSPVSKTGQDAYPLPPAAPATHVS
jgi:hypothetical protein